MEIEYIMALITLMAVVASFASARAARDGVQTARDQIAASIDIAEKQIAASADIAERQIKAELVSANRQKWIEALRNQIVNLLSASHDLSLSAHRGQSIPENLNSLVRACEAVSLHLSPNNELHNTLHTALTDWEVWSVQGAADVANNRKTLSEAFDPRTSAAKSELVKDAAQAVLSAESELVRCGE